MSAATNPSVLERLSELEFRAFGTLRWDWPRSERLAALERAVFGKVRGGAPSKRCLSIERELGPVEEATDVD